MYDPKNITSGIPLLPFNNQVGGHTSIFRFTKKTICKPASQKEQEVYVYLDSHHPELLPFLSQYLGVLNVTYQLDLLPEVIFEKNEKLLDDWKSIYSDMAHSPTSDILEQDFQQWSPNADECNSRFKAFRNRVLYEALNPNALKERIQIVRAWNKENCAMTITSKRPSIITSTTSAPQSPRLSAIDTNETKTTSLTSVPLALDDPPSSPPQPTCSTSSTARWQPRRVPNNPWSQQVYEKDIQKLKQLVEKNQVMKQFILLEDLTDEVQYPCVLDLKMGTRQHGVYADEKKALSQTKKCAKSTSAQLGVRVCGMQVYKEGECVFYDKYSGRQLTPATFRQTLERYLNHPQQLEQIPVLLRKLSRLSRIIRSLKGYRFYGSSLLIIYDASGKRNKIDVRMIDFAKTLTPDQDNSHFSCPPEQPNDPDHGYLLGLKSLVDCFTSIYNDHHTIDI
ncbi:uncharacterized protein EV154DRAFT_503024 [Mucor mucedo]|uniref:uncharacterized protein n=1 Tax=Mucor mucedo TaxID=29922 RepID=UPI002220714E|nr:uncharacterized protein EV154DRAFT_503024 [Mucor mucedo]KAI7893024.1 hypothetical protein EV154DRAFT_503024 [Mucor mucedo]